MKYIYTIKRNDYGWDEYDGISVLASDEQEAMVLAQNFTPDFNAEYNPQGYEIERISTNADSCIILSSFNAG